MFRRLSIICTFLYCGMFVYAQSNDLIDSLLEQKLARLDSVALLLLDASGQLAADADANLALEKFAQLGLCSPTADPAQAISYQDFSYMLMKTRSLNGGLLYSIFPGPRYAFRHLRAIGLLPKNARPEETISGEDVVRFLGRTMQSSGAEE